MKNRLLFIILCVILCVFILSACTVGDPNAMTTQPNPSSSSTSSSSTASTRPFEVLDKPSFAKDAIVWTTNDEAGTLYLDEEYRIITQSSSASAGSAASLLRTFIKTATTYDLSIATDRVEKESDTYYVSEKEILIGTTENRDVTDQLLEQYAKELSLYTDSIGAFYLGAHEQKIIILATDDASLTGAVRFFINQYVTQKEEIKLQASLDSVYLYDKEEFQANRIIDLFSLTDLKLDATLTGVFLDGKVVDGFDASSFSYKKVLNRSEAAPVISAMPWSPLADVNIEQPTEDNNWTGKIIVTTDVNQIKTYTIVFEYLEYDIVSATLHQFKNGAKSAICFMGDDGYWGTTQFMIETCRKYNIKCNLAITANKVGDLAKDANGNYIMDENGNFTVILKDGKTNVSGGGTVAGYQSLIAQNDDVIEISCHTFTHSGFNPNKNDQLMAQVRGAQQILQQAFPGQDVLTYAYAGYSSDTAALEKEKVKEALPQYYIASRGSTYYEVNSAGKDCPYYELLATSFYHCSIEERGKGLHNSDTWFKNAINEAAKYGGWIMTMNHLIQENDNLETGNMTVSEAYFEYVISNYIMKYIDSGVMWNDFFSNVSKYVYEYNHATLECRSYSDTEIRVILTDTADDDIYDYALTIDVNVSSDWESATLKYTNRDGVDVNANLPIRTADDGTHYVRLQLVPDCGEATIIGQ